MSRILLFAPNVHSGGGMVLLKAMLEQWSADRPMVALLDARGRTEIEALDIPHEHHFFASSIRGRLAAEWHLARLATDADIIFCFHNLPPILPTRGQIVCYVHNPVLIGIVPTSHLSGWIALRLFVERAIFRQFRHRITRYIVQTPTMVEALRAVIGQAAPIDVLPFTDTSRLPARLSVQNASAVDVKEYDFLYPSDGPPHKNHARLLAAWEELANQGQFPSLALTLRPDRDHDIRRRVDELVAAKGVKIVDLGFVPHAKLLSLYGQCRAMLFASYAESFGIPLVEAQAAGLPILAAESDFVHDVCVPTLTFDPHSPRSIARAVRRFLGTAEAPRAPLDATAFIDTFYRAKHAAAVPGSIAPLDNAA